LSFLRYAVLNYLNETESREALEALFANLVGDLAAITYVQRLRDFFLWLFQISLSKIFALFEIEDARFNKNLTFVIKKTTKECVLIEEA